MEEDKPIEIAINAVADLFIELHNKKIIKVNEVIEGAVVSGVADRLIVKQKIIDMNVDRIGELEKQLKEKDEALKEAREIIFQYNAMLLKMRDDGTFVAPSWLKTLKEWLEKYKD